MNATTQTTHATQSHAARSADEQCTCCAAFGLAWQESGRATHHVVWVGAGGEPDSSAGEDGAICRECYEADESAWTLEKVEG